MAVFRRAGLPVIASTTDVVAVDGEADLFSWLPDASALSLTTTAAKEWMGFLAYKVRGYL
jgi:hypothetical protein